MGGCARTRGPKCPHAWYFNFKDGGIHYRFSLDSQSGRRIGSKTEAESEATRIKAAILRAMRQRYKPLRTYFTSRYATHAPVAQVDRAPAF